MLPEPLVAQIVASGQQLTVTTPNAVARFLGPDLVGFTNTLTGESYLRLPSSSPLMNLETLPASEQALQGSAWSVGMEPATGATVAAITLQDAVRSATLAVKVDASSQEIVVKLSGQTTKPGVSAGYWAIAGLDLIAGHLIVPAYNGIVFDQMHPGTGANMEYPFSWNAQMAVYESPIGSMLLYSTDPQYIFKQLRIASRGDSTIDLSIATEANGPWPSASALPPVEWRLKALAGDWRTAASVYRDWLAANRPHVSDSNHPWVRDIRTVVAFPSFDSSLLDTLAKQLAPSSTLLYLPLWRQAGYDVNYPDYTPAAGVDTVVAKAHTLGFRVMLHTDMTGVTPGNPDFASLAQWQVKDPGTLQPVGWKWTSPPSTPDRFAYIDPASSAYRKLFISRVGAAVTAIQPDALYLDTSAQMLNDGNGPIEGMTYPQGTVQLHQDVIAAFPNLALGGEGMNDIISAYDSFAHVWWAGGAFPSIPSNPRGHPIDSFLWNTQPGSHVEYFGGNVQPAATDASFKYFVSQVERRGLLPGLTVSSGADLDLTNVDNGRLLHWLESWQTNGFQPAWSADWTGSLIPYRGAAGATASLTDSGSVIRLDAGGTPLYQRVHDARQTDTTAYIPNWPAFDETRIYGLDPAAQYWLEAVPRPAATHISSLPSEVQVGSETMVSSSFALVDLAAAQPFDFLNNLWAAQIGITYKGVDGPLAYGATAQIQTTTAGGVARQGIFMQPPYTSGHSGGEAFVEWPAPVPPGSAFSFAVGVDDRAGTCTDGVVFRVLVNGGEAWRQSVLHEGWVNGSVDLSRYAGTTARLRIVTNPGPANNPNCDWASFSRLSLTPLNRAMISVPMVLRPGASATGFSGDGIFAADPPGNATISDTPVPGRFVVFLAAGTPVASGTSLANLPFEVWSGIEGELPTPGSVFTAGAVSGAASGGQSRQPAIFAHPPDGGRTILSWTLAIPAGGRLNLGWSAGMEDGFNSNTGVRFSVRINGATYWSLFQKSPTGWHPGALDLTPWKGQIVLFQLVTDSVGDNLADHGWWADLTVGPRRCRYGLCPPQSNPRLLR